MLMSSLQNAVKVRILCQVETIIPLLRGAPHLSYHFERSDKEYGCLFVSSSAEKDADPVTQVTIAAPTHVTGNAPLDPAYADEEKTISSIVSKKQRSVALETGSFIARNNDAVKLPIHDRAVAALLDTGA